MGIKSRIADLCPEALLRVWRRIKKERERGMVKGCHRRYPALVERIRRRGGSVNVVFFALFESVWKYDGVYRLMASDPRFNPVILVCPIVNYGRDNMLENMERCYSSFKRKGYNVYRSYDAETDSYVDVMKLFKPDVIFYTNPYEGLIDDRYFIRRFKNVLTAYVPYYYSETCKFDVYENLLLQNMVWRRYVENEFVHSVHKEHCSLKGVNDVVSGYPGIDPFISRDYKVEKSPWKSAGRGKVKRIIWAPHHTIEATDNFHRSTFLRYKDLMPELAEKYKGKIEIAFKPHPILRNKLIRMWGEEATEAYYRFWETMENGMLSDGGYTDLFLTSDAIMHDCGSFIMESMYVGCPLLHLDNGEPYSQQYHALAVEALGNYYQASDKEEIESFIKMVIAEEDPKREAREDFVRERLMPPGGRTASENIITDLVVSLGL